MTGAKRKISKVLVADNDRICTEFLRDALQEAGYEVTVAQDGIEALDQVRECRPDCLILDLVMPKIDGERVCRYLRQDPQFQELPILILSGMGPDTLSENVRSFATATLEKEDLRTTEKKVLHFLEDVAVGNIPDRRKHERIEPGKTANKNTRSFASESTKTLIRELFSKTQYNEMILNHIANGVIITDPQGRIISANPATEKLLGFKEHQLIGRWLLEILPEIDVEELLAGPIVQDPLIGTLERKNRFLYLLCSQLQAGERQKGLLVILRDKTEERASELEKANVQLQRANRTLSHANQIKSEFVANMSHELRSPLNDILGFTQLLLARTYGEVNSRQEDAVSLISESAHTLLNLINSILDISKLESGELDLQLEEVHLADLIEEILKSCKPLVRGRPIQIRSDLSLEIPPLRTDRGKIHQILSNLVHNAIKFTKRGSIKISTRRLPKDSKVEITIEDTGIGIAKSELEAIFDAFRQVDGSTTRQFEGTGLGLAITKKLLDLLQGEITVKSALGVGSTFRLLLPPSLES